MNEFSKEDFIAFAQDKGLYVLGKNDEKKFVECGVDAFLGYEMYDMFFNHYDTPDKSYKDKLALLMQLLFRGSPEAVIIANSKDVDGFAQFLPPGFSGTPLLRYILVGGWKMPFLHNGISTITRSGAVEKYSFMKKNEITQNEDIYLYNLAVKHNMQHRHIASTLIHTMQEYAQNIGRCCYLETYDPNNVTIYERMGFTLQKESCVPNSDLTHYPFLKIPTE